MKELICIGCPMGCRLQVETSGDEIISISGYECRRGKTYAEDETRRPRRMLTALIAVPGSRLPLSVRTREPIPKHLIPEGLREIPALKVKLPVRIGDVVKPDFLGTGVDLIATRDLPED